MSTKSATDDKKKVAKTRNWATVVYPESAPENWRDILSDIHVPALISPLHDKDVNPTGEPKKPHYHVLIMYDGPKEQTVAKKSMESFGGVGCEYINSIRGYARYLCHLDNPEKFQYDQGDVVGLCGAVYNSIIGLPTDKYKVIKEMIAFCKEQGVVAYCDLLEWAMINRDDWFTVLCDSGSFVMREYLKSVTWRDEQLARTEKA